MNIFLLTAMAPENFMHIKLENGEYAYDDCAAPIYSRDKKCIGYISTATTHSLDHISQDDEQHFIHYVYDERKKHVATLLTLMKMSRPNMHYLLGKRYYGNPNMTDALVSRINYKPQFAKQKNRCIIL